MIINALKRNREVVGLWVIAALITASAIETPRTNTDLSICPWGQDAHRVKSSMQILLLGEKIEFPTFHTWNSLDSCTITTIGMTLILTLVYSAKTSISLMVSMIKFGFKCQQKQQNMTEPDSGSTNIILFLHPERVVDATQSHHVEDSKTRIHR